MKRLYIAILFIGSFLHVSPIRVKRFSSNDQRSNEWSWSRDEQLNEAQTKGSAQPAWPSKTNGGPTKGRGDSTQNRDGSWASDGWSSGENGKDGGFDMSWNMEPPQGNNKGSAYPDGNEEGGGNLETILRGVPGMDFPDFLAVPDTEFDCASMPSQGYYGDVEAGCQVFHICQPGNRKDSFLCPVGTIFNQKYFVCDWWYNYNCSDTPSFYDLNNEVYKDPVPVTEEIPVTTEKMLPWNSQDLDKKRPTKSWNPQPPMGKQNTRWKDTPASQRGSKSNSVATSREVTSNWGRSDVQQEVTLAWGASSGTSSGAYGSSSSSSSSFIPTTKPIWYGIDGQPAKDQSNGMSKRTGFVQTPAPFGTRMRSSTLMATANTWAPTEVYQPTTPSARSSSYGTSPARGWIKGEDVPDISTNNKRSSVYSSTTTTRGWLKNEPTSDISNSGNPDGNFGYTTTRGWLKGEEIPETSINPTGVKGVWEQQTTRRADVGDQIDVNTVVHKGLVSKSSSGHKSNRKYQTVSNQRKEWGQRQTFRNSRTSGVANRGWVKQSFEKQNLFENSNINSIPRRKNW